MGKGRLLWFLGIPIALIILLVIVFQDHPMTNKAHDRAHGRPHHFRHGPSASKSAGGLRRRPARRSA